MDPRAIRFFCELCCQQIVRRVAAADNGHVHGVPNVIENLWKQIVNETVWNGFDDTEWFIADDTCFNTVDSRGLSQRGNGKRGNISHGDYGNAILEFKFIEVSLVLLESFVIFFRGLTGDRLFQYCG